MAEREEFVRLLGQDTILENMVLTGLRGVGKTVLLESFKPIAQQQGWLWVGADLSESTAVSEVSIATRLFADLAVVTAGVPFSSREVRGIGFSGAPRSLVRTLDFEMLQAIYEATPGLVADKLKASLENTWEALRSQGTRGVVFAYDEAQTLSDQAPREQYPLSLLLDVFQSIQRKGVPFMLALTGLPTLFPKLVETRTFSERMFRVVFLDRLSRNESREAIQRPIQDADCPVKLNDTSVGTIVDLSGGYPYFIQFICREVYDAFLQCQRTGNEMLVPVTEIERKLDTNFFSGRWARATDRQRELMGVIAGLGHCETEFTVQEIVEGSKADGRKPFSSSHVNQMLVTLATQGLIYKNRHGKYSFAVPLLGGFIKRQPSGVE